MLARTWANSGKQPAKDAIPKSFAGIPRLQCKLGVGSVNDPLESEADTMANNVMQGDGASLSIRSSKNAGPIASTHAPPIVHEVLNSPGQPLDAATRSFMEPRFGYDFSRVRVHTDSRAQVSARAVNAQAYTFGNDLVFGTGHFGPTSKRGQWLLAHELTHVAQQGGQALVTKPSEGTLARKENDPSGPGAGPAPAGPAATKAQSDEPWENLLPHVHATNPQMRKQRDEGAVSVKNPPEAAPSLEYKKGKYSVEAAPGERLLTDKPGVSREATRTSGDPVWAAMVAADDTARAARKAKVDKAIAAIIAARNAIPARAIERSPFGSPKVGNFYDPGRDVKKGNQDAADFLAQARTAVPTTNFDSKNSDDLKKFEIFRKTIPLEGGIGTITTADKTLTIGVGFSSAGTQVEQVIERIFAALPTVKEVAYAAGLKLVGKNSLAVVDTDKGWILEGLAAAAYVQTNPQLLSMFINVSQGVQPDITGAKPDPAGRDIQRQTNLNAQWETFRANALADIPPEILGLPIDSATLAVHSRHALQATFPWPFWQDPAQSDKSVRGMVRAIYRKLRDKKLLYWFVPICGGQRYQDDAKAVQAEEGEAPASK